MKMLFFSVLLLLSASNCSRSSYDSGSSTSAGTSATGEAYQSDITVMKIAKGRAVMSDGSKIDISGLRSSDQHAIFLVRHAEKQDGKDPDLTTAGKARAERLSDILDKVKVGKIISTETTRTQQTVTPLHEAKSVSIESYNPQDLGALAASLRESQMGNIVVAGHSNTTPQLANALLGEKAFTGDFDHEDYGNLLVVSIDADGKASLVKLRY